MEKKDLLAPPPIRLPEEPDLTAATPEDAAIAHPASPTVWAELAELALERHDNPTVAYAYARTGYHRGLDLLRKNGWKGWGPVPFSHAANQGVLRAIAALGKAAKLISEDDEYERLKKMLVDADPNVAATLLP